MNEWEMKRSRLVGIKVLVGADVPDRKDYGPLQQVAGSIPDLGQVMCVSEVKIPLLTVYAEPLTGRSNFKAITLKCVISFMACHQLSLQLRNRI